MSQINENLKAIVISANSDIQNIRKAMNRGAFDFLPKPIDFVDLEQTIEKTLKFIQKIRNKQLETQQIQDQLVQAAFHDALTGLPNRAWLYEHLSQILNQPHSAREQRFTVLFIDLDNFKQINDKLGHLGGDALLREVAQRLRFSLLKGDVVTRLGGDEFVVLLEGSNDIGYATTVAQQIQAHLKPAFRIDGVEVFCGASIGIARSHQQCQRPEDLLQTADMAMYAAKNRGKGLYEVFDMETVTSAT